MNIVNLYEELQKSNLAIAELKDEILYYIFGYVTRQILKKFTVGKLQRNITFTNSAL